MAALSQTVGKLDEASRLPLYQQLQRALRQAIETRVLGPDDALPPERDLDFRRACVLRYPQDLIGVAHF